jgi:hypothetical protein
MKCEKETCTRTATSTNTQYHPNNWLCTYHANLIVKEGRRKRKYGRILNNLHFSTNGND